MNNQVNARDAMPKGGQLTLRTENRFFDKPLRHEVFTVAAGSYAVLSVIDTGCGIDKGLQANIFEPFFTTRALGKGTGLGPATVYGIVKQSGGYIWIDSEPGQGSTFTGYSDHEVVDASSLQGADFLQKPFTPAVLSARVRAALRKELPPRKAGSAERL